MADVPVRALVHRRKQGLSVVEIVCQVRISPDLPDCDGKIERQPHRLECWSYQPRCESPVAIVEEDNQIESHQHHHPLGASWIRIERPPFLTQRPRTKCVAAGNNGMQRTCQSESEIAASEPINSNPMIRSRPLHQTRECDRQISQRQDQCFPEYFHRSIFSMNVAAIFGSVSYRR